MARHTSESQQSSAPNPASKKSKLLTNEPLGSIDVIANDSGAPIERMSFDAHGRRRSVLDWQTPLSYGVDATTRKGFTGHQQLDGAAGSSICCGLSAMKRSLLDPKIWRLNQSNW